MNLANEILVFGDRSAAGGSHRCVLPSVFEPRLMSQSAPVRLFDAVLLNALRHVPEPILERQFAQQSDGFRPARACRDALRRVDRVVREGDGSPYRSVVGQRGLSRTA